MSCLPLRKHQLHICLEQKLVMAQHSHLSANMKTNIQFHNFNYFTLQRIVHFFREINEMIHASCLVLKGMSNSNYNK